MARTAGVNKTAAIASQVAKKSQKVAEVKSKIDPADFISSGSTMLNLALTGNPFCGYQKGKMVNIIGDSGAGKTQLVLTGIAETANNKKHEDVDLYFDDAEHALEFDLEECFGEATAERLSMIDPPSETIEAFSDNLAQIIKRERPFIYALDSFDAIGAEADTDHIESERKIRTGESNKKSTGSYGMAKPKLASQMLREDCGKLKKCKGALLIISQTRDNLTPGSFEKKTRSGGKALKFYATHEIWIILTKSIKSKNRRIGAECLIKVTKNKITGKRREIKFTTYDDYGVDDIGSMIDFMIEEGGWKGGGGSAINTNGDLDLNAPLSRVKLIQHIEDNSLERKLKIIVGKVWADIEESLKVKRKRKF